VTTAELYALLDHLTAPAVAARLDDAVNPPVSWDGWTVSRATGSLNNRIYRATRTPPGCLPDCLQQAATISLGRASHC
jgi:hypothetical protein